MNVKTTQAGRQSTPAPKQTEETLMRHDEWRRLFLSVSLFSLLLSVFLYFFCCFLNHQRQADHYNLWTLGILYTEQSLFSVCETVGGNSVTHSECCHSEGSRDTFTVQQMAHTSCRLWKPSILTLRCFKGQELFQCLFVLHRNVWKHIYKLEGCNTKSPCFVKTETVGLWLVSFNCRNNPEDPVSCHLSPLVQIYEDLDAKNTANWKN